MFLYFIHSFSIKNSLFFFKKYVVKVLMGAVDEWFDTLDEHRVSGSAPAGRRSSKRNENSCCSIL